MSDARIAEAVCRGRGSPYCTAVRVAMIRRGVTKTVGAGGRGAGGATICVAMDSGPVAKTVDTGGGRADIALSKRADGDGNDCCDERDDLFHDYLLTFNC